MTIYSPNIDPQTREVPVDVTNKEAGSIVVTLQHIPVGKYRSLCRDLSDKKQQLSRSGELLDKPVDLSDLDDPEAIEERMSLRAKLVALRERSELELYHSLANLVMWGVIGFDEIYKPDKITKYESSSKTVKWAGVDYQNLDSGSLDLLGKLGLFWPLALDVMAFQNGQLPETLEGFFEEGTEDPEKAMGA